MLRGRIVEFFNKKEEVIDIKLTQFGKRLLARGAFKPVFYQFFDDDILYNSNCAGVTEHQNDTQARIIENTPKMKVQHLTLPIEKRYEIEQYSINQLTKNVFTQIVRDIDPEIQERILLYPLGSHETTNQKTPHFSLKMLDKEIDSFQPDLPISGSGIIKRFPQINVTASYNLIEDRSDILSEPTMVNTESFFDLSSREIIFADNSKIKITGRSIIVDLEELNVFNGLDNFEIEVYKVKRTTGGPVYEKMKNLEEINNLFHIKTDEDVKEVEVKTRRKSNYYKTGET